MNIFYSLPVSSEVSLVIFDSIGRRVADLEEDQRSAGQHCISWDLESPTGNTLSSGVYFCHLRTETETSICKFVVFNH
jgi:hypothetical protein